MNHSIPKRPEAMDGKPANPTSLPSVNLLGVRVHSVTMDQTLLILTAMANSGKAHQIVTVNAEFVMKAQSNREFRDVLNHSDLTIPDGMGVVWGARLFGLPIRERITGVDTVEKIASVAEESGFSMFFLGAAPGIAEKTADELRSRHRDLKIAGTFSGSPRPEDEEEIIAMIRAAQPHFLFVAFGCPAQDLWIARNKSRLNVPVSIGVGGTFDFIAGVAVRAPHMMQRLGLEWLHRLFREPHRWRRMLALPRFAAAVVIERTFTRSR